MTNGITLTARAPGAAARMVAFVAAAWRGLKPRYFAYAVLAGLAMGLIQATADVLQLGTFLWKDLAADIGMGTLQGVMLLLALTVAARVTTKWTPKWLPFVLAPVVVASLSTALIISISARIIPAAGALPRSLFIEVYSQFCVILLIQMLASLGYMRGLDAWKRANALRDAQLERIRLSREAYQARLQALQARVDPRFLFDTLALIEATYAADPGRGQRLMDDLIVHLRAALPVLDDPVSSLDQEWTLVRTWLAIKRVRYGDRLSFSLPKIEFAQDLRVPPMVLLPLVQYAVECIVDAPYDRPHVAIDASIDGGRVRIAMAVPGPAFATETPATTAIRERLSGLYGTEASLALRWIDGEQSSAELEIPHEHSNRPYR